MKDFILLEKEQRVIDILKPVLEKEFSVTVHVGSSEEELERLMAIPSTFSIVLARNLYETDDERIYFAQLAFNKIYDLKCEKPIVSFGSVDFNYNHLRSLTDRFRVNDLFIAIKDLLDLGTKRMEELKAPEFLPVPLSNFYLMTSCCCDVYIKIQKEGMDHYVKRIKMGDTFDKDVIQKYELMNLDSFFVRREDHDIFLNHLMSQSVDKVVKTKKIKDHIEVTTDSYGISQNLIDDLGVSDQLVNMSNVTIGSMMKNIEDTTFGELLRDLLKNQDSFSYKRSYLISLFAHQIIPHMEWGQSQKQLKANFEKIAFVSFFHDILLKDDELLKINSNEDLANANLPGFKVTLVKEHANKISTMVQQFPKAPAGADVIIRQHHGVINGVGFAEKPSSNISPMALVFVVIEDFVTRLLIQLETGKISAREIFDELEPKYQLSTYKKVVSLLKAVVRPKRK
ncbi:hypothetical protein HBN50_10020 [Halobacteriovorax sp. GB3]|uniref:hypothetical protein n=1 Tax=Halobacteriovorax sp. GB3 TaxID=2719615 RepID=UPI00236237D5|nr:hypothetical protein [Halobacteriovorax sp. GB3]MDD0853436.1 hypothetical protein [Halobacteriovorax sp. GB3]